MAIGAAPTIAQLRSHSRVEQALEEAWIDSKAAHPQLRHEERGWIYADVSSGTISVRRAAAGTIAELSVDDLPEIEGSVVVATFHTHPNPKAEGWETGPSDADTRSASILGVPCFIRAEDGIYTTGPDSRRGGLTGNSGFPD